MPPPIRRETESGMDYIGKGFWFAIGFTPVFIVLTTIATIVYINITAQIAEAAFERLNAETAQVIQRSFPAPRAAPAPVAELADGHLSDAEKRERQCSLLVLKYSETQDPAIKKQMYEACPK